MVRGFVSAAAGRSIDALDIMPLRAPIRVSSVDNAPDDLYGQVPFDAALLRRVEGPDRPDYWLAELDRPLQWNDSGVNRTVTHLVLVSRYVGQTISPTARRLTVGIAFVVDQSVLADARLDFAKCRYVAIGEMQPA